MKITLNFDKAESPEEALFYAKIASIIQKSANDRYDEMSLTSVDLHEVLKFAIEVAKSIAEERSGFDESNLPIANSIQSKLKLLAKDCFVDKNKPEDKDIQVKKIIEISFPEYQNRTYLFLVTICLYYLTNYDYMLLGGWHMFSSILSWIDEIVDGIKEPSLETVGLSSLLCSVISQETCS